MPELPEVETVLRGISPHLQGEIIEEVIIRDYRLRFGVPAQLPELLKQQTVLNISRRGKYLLIEFAHGCLIIHLGMSGRLFFIEPNAAPAKHDHIDFILASNKRWLRFRDPRRFGMVLWTDHPPLQHPLLNQLGPEPLTDEFNLEYFYPQIKRRKAPIKSLIMDSKIVVGVGNIYANEALFIANIHPQSSGYQLNKLDCAKLVLAIKHVIAQAIKAGGTSLKDFISADGNQGYFQQQLLVYGRAEKPCVKCDTLISHQMLGQRSTYYCQWCQTLK